MGSNYEDFIKLVAKMRAAQREYFRTRDRGVLQQSKDLERQVDQWVGIHREPDLFGS